MLPPDLKRLDTNPISEDKGEIRLFAVVRNETLRLPYFLDYYRRIGIKQFFVVDNDSQDGTTEFLLTQPDCCVFHTPGSFAAARTGLNWLNPLITQYGDGHWIIFADADEIFVYPRCEQTKLPEFCAWLDGQGYEGVFAVLIDMYSNQPLHLVRYKRGENFLNACNHFDRDYHFVRRVGLPFLSPAFPAIEPVGGPRLRLCFPQQNTPKLWPRLKVKLMRRLSKLALRFGMVKKFSGETCAPQSFKTPLVKWKRGYAYVTNHRVNPIRLAPVTAALLHFKYFQDFGARINDAVERKIHFDGSAEYKRYGELLSKDPALSMIYEGSSVYGNSADLERLRLIKSDPVWEIQ
jgi:Glycosyl transferase family 2